MKKERNRPNPDSAGPDKMKKKFFALLLIMTMVFTFAACGGSDTAEEPNAQESAEQGEMETEEALPLHHVEMTIKDYGTVKLELDPNEAPLSVENFMNLAEEGFYDGLKFHRIIDGFMIQGGANEAVQLEPITGEFSSNGVENTISHVEGVISMARTPDPNSATSQFFITVADSTFLDGDYAAFGYVTEGLDICKQIAKDAKPIDNNGTIPEDEQPVIESVKVID